MQDEGESDLESRALSIVTSFSHWCVDRGDIERLEERLEPLRGFRRQAPRSEQIAWYLAEALHNGVDLALGDAEENRPMDLGLAAALGEELCELAQSSDADEVQEWCAYTLEILSVKPLELGYPAMASEWLSQLSTWAHAKPPHGEYVEHYAQALAWSVLELEGQAEQRLVLLGRLRSFARAHCDHPQVHGSLALGVTLHADHCDGEADIEALTEALTWLRKLLEAQLCVSWESERVGELSRWLSMCFVFENGGLRCVRRQIECLRKLRELAPLDREVREALATCLWFAIDWCRKNEGHAVGLFMNELRDVARNSGALRQERLEWAMAIFDAHCAATDQADWEAWKHWESELRELWLAHPREERLGNQMARLLVNSHWDAHENEWTPAEAAYFEELSAIARRPRASRFQREMLAKGLNNAHHFRWEDEQRQETAVLLDRLRTLAGQDDTKQRDCHIFLAASLAREARHRHRVGLPHTPCLEELREVCRGSLASLDEREILEELLGDLGADGRPRS